MKFSIALSAIVVAFIGSAFAAPTSGNLLDKREAYPNCNSNSALKGLGSGYAVITGWDNNAANVSSIVNVLALSTAVV